MIGKLEPELAIDTEINNIEFNGHGLASHSIAHRFDAKQNEI